MNNMVVGDLFWILDHENQIIKYLDEGTSLPLTEKLLARLNTEIEELHREAKILCDQHWEQIGEINKTKKKSERAKLGIRTRSRTKLVTIEWLADRWTPKGGDGKSFATYLQKGGRQTGYRIESLLRRAQDWEREIVAETERRAEFIRRQNIERIHLIKALEKYVESQT